MLKRNYIKRGEIYLWSIFLLLPPLLNNIHFTHSLVIAGIYAMAALGLSLFMGTAGQISIGHSAFFGLGAYAMAILTTRYGWHPLTALPVGGCLAGAVAFVIGRPLLKFREYFLALVSIGMVHIFQVLATQMEWLTGGVAGIYDIPWFSLFGFTFDSPIRQFYLVWGLLYGLFWFARNLTHSRHGKAGITVALSENVARTTGMNPGAVKLSFFVLSAVYAGVGGGLFACVLTSVSPGSFGMNLSVMFVMAVIIGGMGSLSGAVCGAILLTWVLNLISGYQEYSLPIYGLVLVLLLVFLPEGLFRGIVSRWFDMVRTWADDNWRREIDK